MRSSIAGARRRFRALISQADARRAISTTRSRHTDFKHVVIGGGVVGLATARALSQRGPTILLERHAQLGTETSSRNSEVVHAGLYYGRNSLKTELCIRGRELLYELCAERGVGFKKTGKWIVAQNASQRKALEGVWTLARDLGVPVRWVGEEEVKRDGEGVRAEAGCLESPETGIVDSHGLMLCLAGLFEDAGGLISLNSEVINLEPRGGKGEGGWVMSVQDTTNEEYGIPISTEVVVNAAGLGAVDIYNKIARPKGEMKLYYAKGNYFSYATASPRISRLIYPAPEKGHAGLGTHLTLDLAGRIRFGPDVEWVDSPEDLSVNAERLPQAVEEIKKYLPGIDQGSLQPDYAGMRPKLSKQGAVVQGKGFQDFIVRKEEGYSGWVNLLGIESPGLTSSLAIAERVEKLLYG